jgi:hypothetical protein
MAFFFLLIDQEHHSPSPLHRLMGFVLVIIVAMNICHHLLDLDGCDLARHCGLFIVAINNYPLSFS